MLTTLADELGCDQSLYSIMQAVEEMRMRGTNRPLSKYKFEYMAEVERRIGNPFKDKLSSNAKDIVDRLRKADYAVTHFIDDALANRLNQEPVGQIAERIQQVCELVHDALGVHDEHLLITLDSGRGSKRWQDQMNSLPRSLEVAHLTSLIKRAQKRPNYFVPKADAVVLMLVKFEKFVRLCDLPPPNSTAPAPLDPFNATPPPDHVDIPLMTAEDVTTSTRLSLELSHTPIGNPTTEAVVSRVQGDAPSKLQETISKCEVNLNNDFKALVTAAVQAHVASENEAIKARNAGSKKLHEENLASYNVEMARHDAQQLELEKKQLAHDTALETYRTNVKSAFEDAEFTNDMRALRTKDFWTKMESYIEDAFQSLKANLTGVMSHSSKDPTGSAVSGAINTLGGLAHVFGWLNGITAIVQHYMTNVLGAHKGGPESLTTTENHIVAMIDTYQSKTGTEVELPSATQNQPSGTRSTKSGSSKRSGSKKGSKKRSGGRR